MKPVQYRSCYLSRYLLQNYFSYFKWKLSNLTARNEHCFFGDGYPMQPNPFEAFLGPEISLTFSFQSKNQVYIRAKKITHNTLENSINTKFRKIKNQNPSNGKTHETLLFLLYSHFKLCKVKLLPWRNVVEFLVSHWLICHIPISS